MDISELAEELYELIVVKGRWGGRRHDGSYASLPEWMKELWEAEAVVFAKTHNLPLTDNSNG